MEIAPRAARKPARRPAPYARVGRNARIDATFAR